VEWRDVIWYARYRLPPHEEICYPDTLLPPPETAGFKPSLGEGPGRHYRLPLPDNTGIHVRHHNGKYCIHWDQCDPEACGIISHLTHDAPHILFRVLALATLLLLPAITNRR